jgi:sulfate adenylyltransferase
LREASLYRESLLVHFRRIESLKQTARDLPYVDLGRRRLCDLELLLNRAFYPLDGYLDREDYESVLDNMRLADGTLWPMPICLDVPEEIAGVLEPGGQLALRDEEGFMLAVLTVRDVWQPDKRREALAVYGTEDPEKHPGVHGLFERTGPWYVSGSLEGIRLPIHYDFKELRLTPSETHRRFTDYGWRKVLAFQTEEYLHCAHREMTLAAAREAGANILLHAVTGLVHPGDAEHYAHIRSYRQIVDHYPKNMIMLGLIPLALRRAGPREALWQAMVHKNYGCTHFAVAEDQADPFVNHNGAGRFYPKGAAQEMVAEHQEETGIAAAPLRKMVYVEDRAQYLPEEQVDEEMRVMEISSAELRRRLEYGLEIPEWFSFPEVVDELRSAYPPRNKQGFTVFMTGLSGSGKSTLAKVLLVKFMEMRDRPVTLLDGDIVRRNLSSELKFSREHRNLNVTRIGFVASEITKNGGIALCAPIAPYPESRRHNRELISRYGGYIEVYVATPLEVCEQRDRKGMYAKARAGIMKGVTGIDDPYVPPSEPEITIDTSAMSPEEGAQEVLLYLEEKGYIR